MSNRLESLTIFFPYYNEEANVVRTIQDALRVAPEVAAKYEIIAVDDGSKDGTSEVIRKMIHENAHVRMVKHTINKGYGEALKSGFLAAKMKWVFYTDGDGQFDLNELPLLVDLASTADIVSGYRISRADPFYRKLNTSIFCFALRIFMGLDIPDVDCAFKLYKHEIFDNIQLNSSGALIDAEILAKARRKGYIITCLGVTHKPRIAGSPTGARFHVILKAMQEFWKLWADLNLPFIIN